MSIYVIKCHACPSCNSDGSSGLCSRAGTHTVLTCPTLHGVKIKDISIRSEGMMQQSSATTTFLQCGNDCWRRQCDRQTSRWPWSSAWKSTSPMRVSVQPSLGPPLVYSTTSPIAKDLLCTLPVRPFRADSADAKPHARSAANG